MRRVLRHPHAPTAAALLIAVAYLAVAPATADMAGATFRTWVWETAGWTPWNLRWYGGHHVPGYSVLFGPLAGLLGPRLLGAGAGVAAVAVFAEIARRVARDPSAAALAAWLFVGGAMSNVVIGRVPFTLGLTLALVAWACAQRPSAGRLVAAGLASLAAVWASPVAGLFLAVAAAGLLAGGWDRSPPPAEGAVRAPSAADPEGRGRFVARALALGGPAVVGGIVVAWAFPEGGTDRFTPAAFWPVLLLSLAAVVLLDPGRRGLRAAGALYVGILVVAFALPNPVGQNALRPVLIFGPPLLALAARRPDRREGTATTGHGRRLSIAVAVVAAALVYLQWLPAVRAVAEAHGDPSASPAFHAELAAFLRPRALPGERLEVPLTRNHWEAARLAPVIPLARGWHRQLDRKVAPLFYAEAPLTPARYAAWLRENAVRWVALPAGVPLDFSSREEAALLRAGAPFLRPVHSSSRWTVWEVRATASPVAAPARVLAAGVDAFELDVPRAGTVVVRERHTPYWSVAGGGGCVREAAGGWTAVRVRRPGRVRLRASFSLDAALRREPSCG